MLVETILIQLLNRGMTVYIEYSQKDNLKRNDKIKNKTIKTNHIPKPHNWEPYLNHRNSKHNII